MRINFLLLALFFSFSAQANVLLSINYEIAIGACSEGEVSCKNIPITLQNLKTGAFTKHIGETVHSLCSDKVTPCKFWGYRFVAGELTYFITDSGKVEVTDSTNNLVQHEEGEWFY